MSHGADYCSICYKDLFVDIKRGGCTCNKILEPYSYPDDVARKWKQERDEAFEILEIVRVSMFNWGFTYAATLVEEFLNRHKEKKTL